jgi:hypothetical protein
VSASGPITVRFSEFSLEDGYDFVRVYDGTSTSAAALGSCGYSGTAVPAAVTSTGGAITVVFTSDSADSNVLLTSGQALSNVGFAATLTLGSIDAPRKLVSAMPAALGDLRCIGSITHMCVRSRQHPRQHPPMNRMVCSDLSWQDLTGQLPDTITRLRRLSSMCAYARRLSRATLCRSMVAAFGCRVTGDTLAVRAGAP